MLATDDSSSAPAPIGGQAFRRMLDAAVTVMALGTNKLAGRGAGWLARRGLARYVLPALLLNEAFGAYRAYLAGGAMGWW